jgi:CheY-like chemotaxis protein/MinD-like ATPase involved in chromosome partitioning or flagellar assembly
MAKILIVDDDPDLRTLLRITFTKLGHQVSLAARGEEGLQLAVSEPFDLVVLDVMMPDLDGYEVARRLRANPATKALAILVLTARTQTADYNSAIEAGADGYLPKPIDADLLHRRIAEMLKQVEARRGVVSKTAPAPLHGRVSVVMGLRGGVGATTCAVTLAGALLRSGRRVCLVDLSLSGGHASLQLRLGNSPTWASLPPVPDSTAVAQDLVRHDSGLVVLAAPPHPVRHGLSGDTFQATLEALQIFFTDVVVDAAPYLDDATVVALGVAEQVVLVCTPEVGAVHTTIGTQKAIAELLRPGSQAVIVLNQVTAEQGLPAATVGKALGRAPDLLVPYDRQQALALAHGTPLIFSQPGASLPAAISTFFATAQRPA